MAREKVKSLVELAEVARGFVAAHPDGGAFGLNGELGVGKSSFVREVVRILFTGRGLPVPRVVSPTYVLHQNYAAGPHQIDHFDLYRLENPDPAALMEIAYFEALDRALGEKGNWLFVEWAERLPKSALLARAIQFEFDGEDRILSW